MRLLSFMRAALLQNAILGFCPGKLPCCTVTYAQQFTCDGGVRYHQVGVV